MPNQEAIVENIRKLKEMGLEDEDLVHELENSGIPKIQAERWVRESKNLTTNERPHEENITPKLIPPKQETIPTYSAPRPQESIEKLWEKGILATVDSKLSQMEKLKKELDDVIEKRVNAHYEVMEKKLETLFQAQRELFRFKMDAQMDAKVKDVEEILNQKIDEIRNINTATQEDLQRIKGQKMIITELVADLSTKTKQLEETRREIMDETAKKLEELQEKIDALLDETDERIRGVEHRATKTLELEEKITIGLTEQVETQANRILEDRVKDLRQEIKDEIIQLKKMGADLSSKDIQATLQEFANINLEMKKTKQDIEGMVLRKSTDIDAALEKKMMDVDKIVNTKMETIVTMKEKDFFKRIEEQAGEMATAQRELGQKLLEGETKIQNLDTYTKQFLETLKKANLEREDQLTDFRKKLEEFESRAGEKMALLESRTKQLDIIVSQLSQLMIQWKTQMDTTKETNKKQENPATQEKKTGFGIFGK
ncbi:MAG: hypothetical protein V1776_00980 [Candidatus Diapherotrites archaeon]